MKSALDMLAASDAPAVDRPQRASFEEFLMLDARVPIGGGEHGPYSFEGREAIRGIVRRIDKILGSAEFTAKVRAGKMPAPAEIIEDAMTDALLGVAGGAQWGKTIMELNLAAYLTSQRWLACGLFLPSDDLVQGIVDTKLRPDVIDQIPWFADMTQIGKAVNKSGKTANRKGAFLVTDGKRKASGMVLGLQKIPTSYTFDVTLQDEVDDIPEKNAKFVKGRRTASKLRFDVRIGTQRVHGRGQNKVWKDGSQGVVIFGSEITNQEIRKSGTDAGDEVTELPAGWINPEENFPGIVRCQIGDTKSVDDPQLTWAGDFKRHGDDATVAAHSPEARYYLAHPETGAPLDRRFPLWLHRAPEKMKQRNFTYRAAQLGFDAIGLSQIVAQFQLAVADPDELTVFRCDVLALPQSTAQAITPAIISRSQNVDPFDMRITREGSRAVFGGLDTGDRCWFMAREIQTPAVKRAIYAASIPAGDMVSRGISLFHQLGLSCLFIDQRPLVSQARSLALELNGLNALNSWPAVPAEANSFVSFASGLSWDGHAGRWSNLKCAVVRFDKKQIGAGIEQGFDVFEEDGQTKFVPLIRCNRYETIDRVVRELLTPAESVVDVVSGRVRELPALLLPRPGSPIVQTFTDHIVTGSERLKEKDGTLGDYVDAVPNHLLLADGYSALAEMVSGHLKGLKPGRMVAFKRGNGGRMASKRERSCTGL